MSKARPKKPAPPSLANEPPPPAIAAADVPPAPRAAADVPLCPVHQAAMTIQRTAEVKRYYRCPVDGCNKRDWRWRPVGPLKDKYGHGKSAVAGDAPPPAKKKA